MGYLEPERRYIKPPSHFIHFTAGPTAPEEMSPRWEAHEQQLIQGREGGLPKEEKERQSSALQIQKSK